MRRAWRSFVTGLMFATSLVPELLLLVSIGLLSVRILQLICPLR